MYDLILDQIAVWSDPEEYNSELVRSLYRFGACDARGFVMDATGWLTDAKFADAIKKDLPWPEVAGRFEEGLIKAAEGGEAARTRYQKAAAGHTGYSIGMLRNLAATLQWMRTSKSHLHLPEEVVLKSFTALDLIRRL